MSDLPDTWGPAGAFSWSLAAPFNFSPPMPPRRGDYLAPLYVSDFCGYDRIHSLCGQQGLCSWIPRECRNLEMVLDRFPPAAGHRQWSEVPSGCLPGPGGLLVLFLALEVCFETQVWGLINMDVLQADRLMHVVFAFSLCI